MSYMSEWICSEEELREAVKEDRERIREEIRQAIENGIIKIETGSEKLYARENHTQAEVTGHLIEVLTRKVPQEVDVEAALEALKSGNERTDNWENFSNQY